MCIKAVARDFVVLFEAADWGTPLRVLRGGSWGNQSINCRSANRNHNDPDDRNINNGVRVAVALTPDCRNCWKGFHGRASREPRAWSSEASDCFRISREPGRAGRLLTGGSNVSSGSPLNQNKKQSDRRTQPRGTRGARGPDND
ncbi:MAG: SUMF1/EgtB/PvdO family nonheme iron enzyme [Blastocatellia bacterium]|nr:SUMF1/EgtB/PvdO family nonheme iron enzyme [Blastocatellia bacterium]